MLKIFNNGICIRQLAYGDSSVAIQDAEANGWSAIDSENLNEEILVGSDLHEVSRHWNFDENTEVTITGFELVDGAYRYTCTERDITAENEAKEAEKLEDKKINERAARNQLLAETDWTAGSDVTMSDAMKTYRQALRDVPAQEGFPTTINWPTLGE